MVEPANVPVFVLCGGLGTRFREETEFRPKPMIAIGSRPILWHIMRRYARFGFRHFVLCLGYKGEAIKSYFLNYATLNSDFTVELMTNRLEVHSIEHDQDWKVTLADTGERTMTGGRIARAATAHLGEAEHFAVTYGDGLCDVDLAEELAFHCGHGRVGTVLGANPPSRFGELELDGDRVVQFSEKPDFEDSWINGGYFFFRRDFLSYLDPDEGCVLEQKPLVKLAEDDQLSMFRHRHFWQCMDTQRDWDLLNRLWASGDAPWACVGD